MTWVIHFRKPVVDKIQKTKGGRCSLQATILTIIDLSTYRPGGEGGNSPPTGKFMKPSELGQFWGAEFENRWYTGRGRGLQPRFRV